MGEDDYASFVTRALFLDRPDPAHAWQELRATGVGMELGIGRLGAILGPFIGGVLQQTFASATSFFVVMAAASLISGIAFAFSKPEQPAS